MKIKCERFKGLSSTMKVETVKQLQRALGFLGYFIKFVEGFSKRVSELHEVVSGKRRFTNEVSEMVNRLRKNVLDSNPLYLPDFTKPFRIECDASNVGVGAVLVQEVKEERRVIYFLGRKLNGAEKNYSTIEKELLAIVFGVKKYRLYLGSPFIVVTDHQPLKWLESLNNPQGRIARWKMFLRGF